MFKRCVKPSLIGIAVAISILLPLVLLPPRVTTTGESWLSLETHVAMAASLDGTNGIGEPLPQDISPMLSRGGLPIVSVQTNSGGDLVMVTMDDFPNLIVHNSDVPSWADAATVEATVNMLIQRQLEVWIPLNSFPKDDPVRNGILLDNERLETSGRDYLVITVGYGAIHIYSLSPLDFTTRFNGLDAGPITGEWWQ